MEENDEETNGATKDNDGDEGEEKSPELNIQPGETIQGAETSYRVIRRIGEFHFIFSIHNVQCTRLPTKDETVKTS